MNSFNSPKAYEDPFVVYEIYPMLDSAGQVEQIEALAFEKLANLRLIFYNKVKNYAAPHILDTDTFDDKLMIIAVNDFIKYYGLQDLTKSESKLQLIIDRFSKKELIDAINDSIPKTNKFYNKYNDLVINLSK